MGVTNTNIVGTATPGATVSETETWPDGTNHSYSATANGSGNYTLGPFIIQQLGTYNGTVHDSISGSSIPITYSGTGDFSASVNTTSQTVTKGSAASYTVTFSSVSGFAGTVIPAALNFGTIPGVTGSWSPPSVTVPSNSSATATFTIQTSSSTTAGTYSNITLQGANGSVTHAASLVSLTVNGGASTLTASLSPSSATVGVTNTNIVGTASPGATVSETETWPDGTSHSYSTTANGSGSYTMGPFIIQQLGTYNGTVHDSISGSSIPITYSGTGNFSASVNTTSQTVTKGSAASYTVTFSSVSGFAGTVIWPGAELVATDTGRAPASRSPHVGYGAIELFGHGDVHDPDLFEHDGGDLQQHHAAGCQRISYPCGLAGEPNGQRRCIHADGIALAEQRDRWSHEHQHRGHGQCGRDGQ